DAVCGDYNVDAGEGCDDGNRDDGDACSSDCTPTDRPWGVLDDLDVAVSGALVSMGRIGNTLVLTLPALTVAMLLSLVLGTWAGWRRGAVDVVVRGFSALTSSVPAFFVGLLLVTLFAEWWQVLPSGGVFSPGIHNDGVQAVVVDRVRHAVLPVTVLVLFWTGRFVRQVRSAVIAAAAGDYVRTVRMKGASTSWIVRHHVLKNAAVPLVTLVGLSLPALFGGALLTETVFAWPGLGRLQYDAILQNDSYVAVVVFLISAAMVLLGSLLADVLVFVLDPRTRGRR
ncbi:MAG TPA: ABC transporter permease subunit, partial [Myxococcota bacterium]